MTTASERAATSVLGANCLANALAHGRRDRDVVYWGPACGRFRRSF